ncbi:unnamed protein product [Pylaiella littoralis]
MASKSTPGLRIPAAVAVSRATITETSVSKESGLGRSPSSVGALCCEV